MCARGYAVKTDDRGKSRKLVCSDVLEEMYREGDRRVCRPEMGGRAAGVAREDEWREPGQEPGNGWVGSWGGQGGRVERAGAGARKWLGGQLRRMEAVF